MDWPIVSTYFCTYHDTYRSLNNQVFEKLPVVFLLLNKLSANTSIFNHILKKYISTYYILVPTCF